MARLAAVRTAWMTAAAAARELGVDPRVVQRLADEGRIAVRPLPVRARYARADVEALADPFAAYGIRRQPDRGGGEQCP